MNTEDERLPLAPTSLNAATQTEADDSLEVQQRHRKVKAKSRQHANSPLEQKNRIHTSREEKGKRCTHDPVEQENPTKYQVEDVHVEEPEHQPIRHRRPQISELSL